MELDVLFIDEKNRQVIVDGSRAGTIVQWGNEWEFFNKAGRNEPKACGATVEQVEMILRQNISQLV